MRDHRAYAETRLDERRMRAFARRVASTLRARGELPRSPRPSKTTTEIVTEGGFFKRRNRTIEYHDDGGTPRFWIIDARCESGVFIAYQPGSLANTSGWMSGDVAVLLEDGELEYADWREEPFGAPWTISGFRDLTAGHMTQFDYAEEGRWRKVKLVDRRREQWRQEFNSKPVLNAHAAGVALSRSLSLLRDGKGIPEAGHMTGMPRRPRSPF